ncbi:MAG: serine/threonine-protein kinase [Pseudomonadota bacterium]|nr:serine/threonine-protein kinase [Pseudomonadota bacterium]
MPADDRDAAHFAALREQFHRLAALDVSAHEQALQQLELDDPALAITLRALLQRFDARDLNAPSAVDAPTRLGPFRALHLLGRGGMGEVFYGERADGAFDQQVALKVIRRDFAGFGLDQRFVHERHLLSRLQHPHIARLIDGGISASGQPWLAMEYVDGVDLSTWLTNTRANLRRRITLYIKICEAVAFAHRALIVHRDLKPANILIDRNDQPKLLDFGIAKLIDDDAEAQPRTMFPALTLRYAAPEQVLGDRTTTATDVYALGVLLFELISCRSPYCSDDDGITQWSEAIVRGKVRPLGSAIGAQSALTASEQRQATRDLACVIDKAMATAPSQRYAAASLIADDLTDWLAQRPLRSGVGTLGKRALQFVRQHRWLLLTAATTALVLLISTIVAVREARQARQQTAIARANVDALLGVLSAANPMRYTGRDPAASEFLVTAAMRIQRDHGHDPVLVFRALCEVGHGLINLGQSAAAEKILTDAMTAASRATLIDAVARLGCLKLLAIAHEGEDPAALSRIQATAARIEALAITVPTAPIAADALATIAGALARRSKFDEAGRLFAISVRQLAQTELPPHTRENILRQKGWSALRAGEPEIAAQDLRAARAVIDANPGAFSSMRVAEANVLLAEAAIDRGHGVDAKTYFALAEPVLLAEYQGTHPERRSLLVIKAATRLVAHDYATALSVLDQINTIAFVPADAGERTTMALLRAQGLAGLGRCDEARIALATAVKGEAPRIPRFLRRWAIAKTNVSRSCN